MTDRQVDHLRDDQLLLHASGELHESSAELLSAHFASCLQCKARLQELENALDKVTRAHRIALSTDLPSVAGPRALLKAQLARLSDNKLLQEGLTDQKPFQERGAQPGRFQHIGLLNWRSGIAAASLAVMVLLFANTGWLRSANTSNLTVSSLSDEPNVQFTPGAVVAVTQRDVCSESSETSPSIPLEIKNKVLRLYGVAAGKDDAYEVDYLITPELGGATDVRNLWPEPYNHTVWNAHVKDRLEDRLHEMVCRGDLDLATAQRDISTDWIAAYRKYFHEDVPVGSS
jgi:hypothetical protein